MKHWEGILITGAATFLLSTAIFRLIAIPAIPYKFCVEVAGVTAIFAMIAGWVMIRRIP